MDEAQVREAITLGGHPQTTAITPEIAREACLRQGAKATLEGSIASIGSSYLLSLQAVNCQSGATLAREQTEAANKEKVVEVLGKATAAMRQKLGESLSNVQVEEITYKQALSTGSLEALESFRLGDREYAAGDSRKALPHFLRAAELDSNFAMAFCVASLMFRNLNDTDKAREYDAKAYALLDRVRSERERLFITSQHHTYAGDLKKLIESQEVLVRTYPRDPIFHGNLASSYSRNGQFAKAAAEAEAEIEHGPHIAQGYGNAYGAYLQLNRTQDAKRVVEKGLAQGVNVPAGHARLLYIAFVEGDQAGQEKELKWFAGKPEAASAAIQVAENALALGKPGKAREAVGKSLTSGFAERVTMLETGRTPPPPDPMPANPNGQTLYASGQAFLAKGNSAAAAAEFQRILDNRLRYWGPFYSLAFVGLARAEAMGGNTAKAQKAYEDFFALWKNAETNLPVLLEARKEYSQLK
jgi:tetratricopeptide (TPR) repeat protein